MIQFSWTFENMYINKEIISEFLFLSVCERNEGFWNAFNSFRHHTKSEPTQSTLSSWRTTPATAPSTSSNSRSEEVVVFQFYFNLKFSLQQPTFKSPFPPKNNQITTNVNGGDGSPNVKRNRIHAGLGTHSPSAVKTIDITNPQPYKFEVTIRWVFGCVLYVFNIFGSFLCGVVLLGFFKVIHFEQSWFQ